MRLVALGAVATMALSCAATDESFEEREQALSVSSKTDSQLQVELSMAQEIHAVAGGQMLTFSLTNISDKNQRILRWATPLGGEDADFFKIVSPSGIAGYVGKAISRLPPTERDYLSLAPGETRSVEVDLALLYDIHEAGLHSVEYVGPVSNARGEVLSVASSSTRFRISNASESKIADLDAPKALPAVSLHTAVAISGSNTFQNCSSTQQNSLTDARRNAALLGAQASRSLNNASIDDRQNSSWYNHWFGAYNGSRYNTVASKAAAIDSALQTQNFTFECAPADCQPSWGAYVYPNSPYNVYLCSQYWPADEIGVFSKSDMLVHEVSHFSVVADTDDIAVGYTAAENLASSNPAQAIKNSYNYQFYTQGAVGEGTLIGSDNNSGLHLRANGSVAHGAYLKLSSSCTTTNPECLWILREGMILNAANPSLAVNAWDGAAHGRYLRLHRSCASTNPNCTWTYQGGMLKSDSNTGLAMNAWGGATNGAWMRLNGSCGPTNADCTWTQKGLMITSDSNPELGVNAYGGATHGANIVLHRGCTSGNTDCTWNYKRGMLISGGNSGLAINAWGGASHLTQLRLHQSCANTNSDCTWTLKNGVFHSDSNPALAMNAYYGATTGGGVKLWSGCPASNTNCTWGNELKQD